MARKAQKAEEIEEQPMLPIAAPRRQKDRAGKRAVVAHLEPAVARAVRVLAAKKERTIASLYEEAIEDMLSKYGQSINEL